MKATLADAALTRYAGRFVWLELDFDKPQNASFIAIHGTTYTPSFYVLDPGDEHAVATQLGAMRLPELMGFLERAERGRLASSLTPADRALALGDERLARGQVSEAVAAYEDALNLGNADWPERERAVGALSFALATSRQWQACAETASQEAPHMSRHEMFGRVVLEGLTCLAHDQDSPWASTARTILEPLGVEAISLPETVRDHRFKLYQELMGIAEYRKDRMALNRWGSQWLAELEATKPANDDERSALDIARVDAAREIENPLPVLPALRASEKAMPGNYNASLRLAQMELLATNYQAAIAACDRGLQHVTGPLGQAWLMRTKADSLLKLGKSSVARRVLVQALASARRIGPQQARESNVRSISTALKEIEEIERRSQNRRR